MLTLSAVTGCHAEARLGNPEVKAPEPPPPPAPPPAPEPVKAPEPVVAPKAFGRVSVQDSKIVISEQIQFDQNKATIKPESFGLVEEIAKTIKENEKIKKVSVEGHTSLEGDAAANMKLSQDRAASVMKALVERGVDGKRLASKGFGVTKPIGDNGTPAGRITNRRVEFQILDK